MKVEKKLFGLLLLAVLLFSFTSCLSQPTRSRTLDNEIPKEQTATVFINYSIKVKEYNGINVESWYPKSGWSLAPNIRATIPAGDAEFLLDYDHWIGRGNYYYVFKNEDVILKYKFEAGRQYTIGFNSKRNEDTSSRFRRVATIEVWDGIYKDRSPRDPNKILASWIIGEY